MKILVGSDHAGLDLKEVIKENLSYRGFDVSDAGTHTTDSCDYSEYALKVARAVAAGEYDQGILICGTGIGMSMAANRIAGARAALCRDEFSARMSRSHNNANILCLGERVTGQGLALSILNAWLESNFEGGRHQRRVDLFDRAS